MPRVSLALLAPFIAGALLFSEGQVKESRASLIARAHVWMPTNVASMAIKTGPAEPGAFPFLATVPCEYLEHEARRPIAEVRVYGRAR